MVEAGHVSARKQQTANDNTISVQENIMQQPASDWLTYLCLGIPRSLNILRQIHRVRECYDTTEK